MYTNKSFNVSRKDAKHTIFEIECLLHGHGIQYIQYGQSNNIALTSLFIIEFYFQIMKFTC